MSVDKYSAILEAILFCENDVIKPDRIQKITGLSKPKIKEIMNNLIGKYQDNIHGMIIVELAGGYSFQIKKDIYPHIKEYYNVKHQSKLSKSVITVLSIIAYKQQITKSEIEDIRGVSSDNQISKLLDLDLIQILGRKDVVGRPLLYGTTEDFLKHFNLKNIKDLPQINELKSEEFTIE